MKKYNYIYLITNNTNGKIYIGQHRTDDLDDGYMGSGTLLLMAKQKYGIENFSKEIIAYADTKEKLDYLERFYIRKYKAQNKNIGYNIQPGGGGYEHTEDTKQTISEKLRRPHPWAQGKKNPMYGKNSEDFMKPEAIIEKRRKISIALKGRKYSPEYIEKQRKAQQHPHEKFEWVTPNGEIFIMDKSNAKRYHPDWILKIDN